MEWLVGAGFGQCLVTSPQNLPGSRLAVRTPAPFSWRASCRSPPRPPQTPTKAIFKTMYWPIRAPRIYVAKIPPPSIPIDYDSEESAELVQHSLSFSSTAAVAAAAAAADGDDAADPEGSRQESTEDEDEEGRKVGEKEVEVEDEEPSETPSAGAKTAAARSPPTLAASAAQDEATRSHIVALRVARSGLLFATVTRAELTIWQTKVSARRTRELSSDRKLTFPCRCRTADRSRRARAAVAYFSRILRPQRRRPRAPGFADLRRPDIARIPHDLFARDRSQCARLPDGLRQRTPPPPPPPPPRPPALRVGLRRREDAGGKRRTAPRRRGGRRRPGILSAIQDGNQG